MDGLTNSPWTCLGDERSTEDQIASLSESERNAFDELKAIYVREKEQGNILVEFTDYQILRFARNSPGVTKFNVKTASKVMKNYAAWTHKIGLESITVNLVRDQLMTTCLSVPGTKSIDGHTFLYMKPALFFPRKDSLDDLMMSLIYLLENLTAIEKNCTEGIAVMCNMDHWGLKNFGVHYAKTFFDTMQGRFPMRVRMFLIVNPPSWFSTIWKVIRPMMTKDFAAKVKLPKKKDICKFVDDPKTLPSEFGGQVDVEESIKSFMTLRYQLEGQNPNEVMDAAKTPQMTAEAVN
mmetsp:Transcript_19267/g.32175  ORF Transcript_19267/g.32175 Transcript_19267/m.32175 type:complete len:293 (+) Transcript_19267:185-1063(+)